MLTIDDLKNKMKWEDAEDILDLLNLSTSEMLDYLTDEIETHQDKLRDYYDEDAEELDWEDEEEPELILIRNNSMKAGQ